MSETLPDGARRLVSDLCVGDVSIGKHSPFIIGRLLEDGDGEDLAWLSRALPEETLAQWVRNRGDRQLSRRSAAFWSLILDQPPERHPESDIAEMLWTL